MRLLPTLALSASIALGACQHPDGSTDWGSTAALGIGAAALVGLAAVAANNSDNDRYYRRDYRRQGGYRQRGYDRYASGWDRPYRSRW
ncbi:hypothetical protein [Neoroseomonas soli]|uniref:Lipoprotein n=1 Tax=Neoroseomonas soli TaxID=1081025 RepID=A0A9X9WVE5_9PROT|nr:hypothetical protein [Neoroseomonas soli]MBR0671124.1 hypothetical protein [Neoroseomonas soli]